MKTLITAAALLFATSGAYAYYPAGDGELYQGIGQKLVSNYDGVANDVSSEFYGNGTALMGHDTGGGHAVVARTQDFDNIHEYDPSNPELIAAQISASTCML